jgi:hypothetical protein
VTKNDGLMTRTDRITAVILLEWGDARHAPPPQLHPDRAFLRDGFCLAESFFDQDHMERLVTEIDGYEDGGRQQRPYRLHEHGHLTANPDLLATVTQLIGKDFVWHHIHSYRHRDHRCGVEWHSDYNQVPQTDRRFIEIIALIYPRGLNPSVGSLVVVPGSQHSIQDWGSLAFLGTSTLPGEIVIDQLAPGSVVFAHTGLTHCRRPSPTPATESRYFCDTSYGQAGVRWASYDHPWWRDMLRECRERGYDRSGSFVSLYDENRFYDQLQARACLAQLDHARLAPFLAQAQCHA